MILISFYIYNLVVVCIIILNPRDGLNWGRPNRGNIAAKRVGRRNSDIWLDGDISNCKQHVRVAEIHRFVSLKTSQKEKYGRRKKEEDWLTHNSESVGQNMRKQCFFLDMTLTLFDPYNTLYLIISSFVFYNNDLYTYSNTEERFEKSHYYVSLISISFANYYSCASLNTIIFTTLEIL